MENVPANVKSVLNEFREENTMTQKQMKYVMVRTFTAGVFTGYLESKNGKEVVLRNARRIWFWEGAATLSQLAMEGTKKPLECKFPCPVDRVNLLEAIEILDVTDTAKKSIEEVPVWTALLLFLSLML